MAAKRDQTEYEDALAEAKLLSEGADSADYSLEEILAEYGESRAQKLLREAEGTPDGSAGAGAVSAPADASKERAAPTKPSGGEGAGKTGADASAVSPYAAAPEGADGGAHAGKTGARAAAPVRGEADGPGGEDAGGVRAAAEPSTEAEDAPRPISMEEVVGSTVDAVMEERLLPERGQRRGLFSRRRFVETEELYQRPEKPPEEEEPLAEEEPIGPEPPLEEAAALSREAWNRLRRPLPAAALLSGALCAVVIAQEQGAALPAWSQSVGVQTGVMLSVVLTVSALCRGVFVRAFRLLGKKRCSGELLCALSALAATADCAARPFLTGRSEAMPYAAAACAALVFAQWGCVLGQRGRFDMYRAAALSDEPPYLVTDTPEGACKQAGRREGFYTDAERPDLPVLWQSALLPVILMGTVVFAGLASLGQGRREDFLLCWSVLLTASAAFSLPLCWALPWSGLARRLQKSGCAVAGWAGAEAVSRKRAMILTDADLFPPGALRLNGIKVFGEEVPHAASYAAALSRAAGSGLFRLFDALVRSEGGQYYEPDDFSFYEEGGCSATIRGESVLLGTASFMRKMEVRLPGNLNLRTGVFLAVDRRLAAVFAVKYSASENVDWALRVLRHSRITPILAARDANITPALLHRKFGKHVRVDYPALSARVALSEQEGGAGRPRALLLREGLAPYAETVAGSRRLCRTVRRCTAIALLGSVSGELLAYYLAMQGGFSLMPPGAMVVFLLLWTLPTLLLTGLSNRM